MNNKMNSKSKGRIFVSCSFSTFFLKPKNYILTGGPSPGPRPIPKMAERYDQRDRCTKRENHFSVCRKEGEQKCWNFQRKKMGGEVTTFAVPWALCWPNRTIYPIRHMRPLRLESRYLSPFWFSFSFIQKDFRVPLDNNWRETKSLKLNESPPRVRVCGRTIRSVELKAKETFVNLLKSYRMVCWHVWKYLGDPYCWIALMKVDRLTPVTDLCKLGGERLTRSECTQRTFDRAFKELSIGMHRCEIHE